VTEGEPRGKTGRDCAPAQRVPQRKPGPAFFALAPGIPTAIESRLQGLMPGNSAISAKIIKDAGVKMEVN
jgi:hypothetical protein